ncbi:MAG: carbon storage regulator [Isosphaeraceae bacterium]
MPCGDESQGGQRCWSARKLGERIVVGDIRITVVGIRGNHVPIRIEAPHGSHHSSRRAARRGESHRDHPTPEDCTTAPGRRGILGSPRRGGSHATTLSHGSVTLEAKSGERPAFASSQANWGGFFLTGSRPRRPTSPEHIAAVDHERGAPSSATRPRWPGRRPAAQSSSGRPSARSGFDPRSWPAAQGFTARAAAIRFGEKGPRRDRVHIDSARRWSAASGPGERDQGCLAVS